MKCKICNSNEIGPQANPHGAFLCPLDHLQCFDCDRKNYGKCCQCNKNTKFEHDVPEDTEAVDSSSSVYKTHQEDKQSSHYKSNDAFQKNEDHEENFCPMDSSENLNVANPLPSILSNVSQNQSQYLNHMNEKDPMEEIFSNGNIDVANQQESNFNAPWVMEQCIQTFRPIMWLHYPSNYGASLNKEYQSPRNYETQVNKESKFVSTESEPSLTTYQYLQNNFTLGNKTQNYVVMPATGKAYPKDGIFQCMDKGDGVNLDRKMQKLLQTLHEDAQMEKHEKKSEMESIKKSHILRNHDKDNQDLANTSKSPEESPTEKTNSEATVEAYHAHYSPMGDFKPSIRTLHTQSEPKSAEEQQPPRQFLPIDSKDRSPIPCVGKPLSAYTLNIPRDPIKCPSSRCQREVSFSGFCKHLTVDHMNLACERISPYQCKNLILDARLAGEEGNNRCHMLYLLTNKIQNLCSGEYEDYLPVMVMSSSLSMSEMMGLKKRSSSKKKFLIFWLTCITHDELSMSITLTVWPRSGQVPKCHMVYSGKPYSLRSSQRALDVWKSGNMLMLSPAQVEEITGGGKDMINMQLEIH
ncbi:uncharacterized protein LOC142240700 [Haematobia irritans]|uniref:uncharacterized protein LOC142240700 n=1 Tax=Haematobia irritans TaxID=7368 RepID=UPI003F50A0CD